MNILPSDVRSSSLGVLQDPVPRWQAPKFQRPTFSTVMTTMVNFGDGARASANAGATANVNRVHPGFCIIQM
jgi:hypothetical protein